MGEARIYVYLIYFLPYIEVYSIRTVNDKEFLYITFTNEIW